MKLSADIARVGVADPGIRLFEGQYAVPEGMTYNSYLVKGEKTAVMDSVERSHAAEWLDNIGRELGGREPDYLVVQHMEPDHSGSVTEFLARYPGAAVVATAKAFDMMKAFYGEACADRRVAVKDGDTLDLGGHVLRFLAAPMVHWPEVVMTLDESTGTLFSADAFGRFGADVRTDAGAVLGEARRYYIGIVGKYGAQVKAVLGKLAGADVRTVCPLHGQVIEDGLGTWLGAYSAWAEYRPESDGVLIAAASVYGNTMKAAELLAAMLRDRGVDDVKVADLTRCDMSAAVADAFRYGTVVFAAPTYNNGVFPAMRRFVTELAERNWQKRTCGLIENGSWAPAAAKTVKALLEGCRDITFAQPEVRIMSAPDGAAEEKLGELADALAALRAGKTD